MMYVSTFASRAYQTRLCLLIAGGDNVKARSLMDAVELYNSTISSSEKGNAHSGGSPKQGSWTTSSAPLAAL